MEDKRIYLELALKGTDVGRIEVQLNENTPNTNKNFLHLCSNQSFIGSKIQKINHEFFQSKLKTSGKLHDINF